MIFCMIPIFATCPKKKTPPVELISYHSQMAKIPPATASPRAAPWTCTIAAAPVLWEMGGVVLGPWMKVETALGLATVEPAVVVLVHTVDKVELA